MLLCVCVCVCTENNTVWLNGRLGARCQSGWDRHTSEQANLSLHFLLPRESIKRQKGLFSIREWDRSLKWTFLSIRISAAAAQLQWQSLLLLCPSTSQESEEETLWDFQDVETWPAREQSMLSRALEDIFRKAETFWAAPKSEGEPTSIGGKRLQFASYLKPRAK